MAVYLLIALMLNGQSAMAQDSNRTPKSVFIIVDGIPADVLERTDTPNIDAIAADGGYARAYVGGEVGGDSETPTVSAPGYASLVYGTWANKHNIYDNDVEEADYRYWDIFRIAKVSDPSLHTAVFSTWLDNRTKVLGDGLAAAGGDKIDHHFDGFEIDTEQFPHDALHTYIRDIDEHVSRGAARHIEAEGADLSWVYLQFTDDVGHAFGDSPQQRHALEVMDGNIGIIRDAVRRRAAAAGEDWLIVVTTDHGRDEKTGKGHGGQSERERTIWIATDSAHLNERFHDMPAIVDILPSIASHMGLTVPDEVAAQLDGESFIDRGM